MGCVGMGNRGHSELVKRVLSGDTQAYEELFLLTKDNIFFHAKMALLNEENAWDIVQNTYTAAFRSLPRLNTPESAEVWFCAIAGNLCFSKLHKQRSAVERGAVHSETNDGSARAMVEDGLMRLTDMQRIAVLFRYIDDMSLAQIGTVLRCAESAVGILLADSERVLGVCRENSGETASGEKPSITPTELKAALNEIKDDTRLSPSVTVGIAETLAKKCGYTSAVRVMPGTEPITRTELTERDNAEMPPREKERVDAPRRDVAPPQYTRTTPRKSGMVLASGLVVVGLVVGAFSVRAVMDMRSGKSQLPDNLDSFLISGGEAISKPASDEDNTASVPIEPLSVAAAQAYIGVVSDYTGRFGVCASESGEGGLAHAELIDFDGDGQQEMYLYYIDKSFSPENDIYRVSAAGEEQWCLHEQLWCYDGELKLVYEQEHCALAAVDSVEGSSRWLCVGTDGRTRIFSWYSYTDENGYINHSSMVYALSDGELSTLNETTGIFVVANEVKHRRDGYLVEEYYGTDNSHFDDIAYFVEGAITTADGRTSYNYEQCQAILDIGTADVVPLNSDSSDTPVAKLAEAYSARELGTQVIAANDGTLTWAVNDVNAFLSMLADICTGNQ